MGGEDLDRGGQRRLGEGMGVHPKKQWTADLFRFPVFADGSAYRQDMPLVEAIPEG